MRSKAKQVLLLCSWPVLHHTTLGHGCGEVFHPIPGYRHPLTRAAGGRLSRLTPLVAPLPRIMALALQRWRRRWQRRAATSLPPWS